MSTKYTIQSFTPETGEFESIEQRSSKPAAEAVAHKLHVGQRVTTRVVTGSGTVVKEFVVTGKRLKHVVPAKPYTRLDPRVQELSKDGWEAAYSAPRRNSITLRRKNDEGKWEYALSTREGKIFAANLATTRACHAVTMTLPKIKSAAE